MTHLSRHSRPANSDKTRVVRQRTLKTAIHCSGIALHSGARVTMTLRPAEANSGVVFKRTDIKGGGAIIEARFDKVVDTRLCTVLGNEHGVTVGTVEHLLAALSGCGIDNAQIEINGPEVPIMDGSAAPFVFLIECAGVAEQDAPRQTIQVLKPVVVEDQGRTAALLPDDRFGLDVEIDFKSPAISRQGMAMGFGRAAFKNDIARARTFGFLHEVEMLRQAGLARGGSLQNAIVISNDKVMNEDGLRFDDEFVRHKVLDAVGDLYLAGAPIRGRFRGICTGHALNNKLLHALFADPSAYRLLPQDAEHDAGFVLSGPLSDAAFAAAGE